MKKKEHKIIYDDFLDPICKKISENEPKFAEVIVDPEFDESNLACFLLRHQLKKVGGVFSSALWTELFEAMQATHQLYLFARSRLVIKQTDYESMKANSKQNFRASVAKYKELIESGQPTYHDIEFVLCFEEKSGQVTVDLNRFVPFVLLLVTQACDREKIEIFSRNK